MHTYILSDENEQIADFLLHIYLIFDIIEMF